MDIRLEAHSLLVDDDLPFDLFGGEIRAFIKLFVPGDYGRIDEQYLIRFQSGAALLLTPQEARQVEESLHHNTGVDAFGYKQGTPSPAWPHRYIHLAIFTAGKTGKRQAFVTLMDERDIVALEAREGKFKLDFPLAWLWMYLDAMRGEGEIGRIFVNGETFDRPVTDRHYDRKIGVVGMTDVNGQSIRIKWSYENEQWVLVK